MVLDGSRFMTVAAFITCETLPGLLRDFRTASDKSCGRGLGKRLLSTHKDLSLNSVRVVLLDEGAHPFFPPRRHIFMHSAHTTFVGTPLPQHLLLNGQSWWGPHNWRDPSGNTVNDIHDPPQAQQSEVNGECRPDFRPAFS